MMFGYATDETEELMPTPIMLAHKLAFRLAEVRKTGVLPYLRPDGKTQVTVEYVDGVPKRVRTVVVAAQHIHDVTEARVKDDVLETVVIPTIPEELVDRRYMQIHVNATGRFVLGGPQADAGLTGRKIIVDTYGGMGCHGGGCFSGKDPTKVDRSGSYTARYVAKNLVASGLTRKCEVQLAYVIGVADPVSIMINTYGTGKVAEERLVELVRDVFDLKPLGMIEMLNLRRPIYRKTAAYGHFGRGDKDFTWERTDKAQILAEKA
jgi:S-adenosylmethionine synthetase